MIGGNVPVLLRQRLLATLAGVYVAAG